MKRLKKCLAAVLALALTLMLVTAASLNWTDTELGDLSQYYETGSVGAANARPGYISTTAGDPGGTSYGIYMFASKADTPYSFAKWLAGFPAGDVRKTMGDTLVEAYEYNLYGEYVPGYGSNFNAKWEQVAAQYPSQFYAAQKEYWETTSYDTVIKKVRAQYPAFDMGNYSMALQNVFWSRSVQNGVGGATNVITNAFAALGGFKNQSEEELIAAIYAECSKLSGTPAANRMTDTVAYKYGVGGQSMAYFTGSSGDVQIGVYRRLHVNEPADALVMLYQKNSYAIPNGTYQLLKHADQSRGLANGTLATTNIDSFKLTNYNGGYVTLSVGDKRLTDNGGAVTMAAASASSNQMWQITPRESGGYLLQNRGSGKYLAVNDSGAAVTAAAESATAWQISAQAAVSSAGLFYPGCEEGRTNKLVAGNSSYPLRGVLTCAKPISNVTVAVKTGSGAAAFVASSGTINANWYDLWKLDDACTFSKLSAGDYTLTLTATVDKTPVELAKSSFTVSKNTGTVVDDETYTVTLDPAGGTCGTKTVTYKLGDVYGQLPAATRQGYEFRGWFLPDGTEATPTTPVAARNHTLTAKYGDLHTVTFLGADGKALKTAKLAKGELITAPDNPIRAADSQYTYSFSYWADGQANRFVAGATYMGESDITYTPVFTRTAIPAGGTTTQPVDGGYQTGFVPGTAVSALSGKGYAVYDGAAKVTSGDLATGMTAVFGKTSVTVVVTGDTNGDGKLTITDIMQIRSHLLAKSTLSGAYAKAADLNGDGKITITDAVQATSVSLGRTTLS